MAIVLLLTAGILFLILQKRDLAPGQTATEQAAVPEEGDVQVSAPPDGVRELDFGPARLVLDTGAEIRLTSPKVTIDSEVVLLKGRLTATVRPLQRGESFKVRTFNITAGVRGTKFTVAIIGGIVTIVHVIEGSVWIEAATGNPIMLSPGQSAHAHGMSDPEIIDSREKSDASNDLSALLDKPVLPDPNTASSTSSTAGDILQGSGTWNNSLGFSGPITLSIDLKMGTYTGQFRGENKTAGAATDRAVTLDGRCGGTFKGTRSSGTLDGWVEFSGTDAKTGLRTPGLRGQASGSLNAGTITGTFQGAQQKGEFKLNLK